MAAAWTLPPSQDISCAGEESASPGGAPTHKRLRKAALKTFSLVLYLIQSVWLSLSLSAWNGVGMSAVYSQKRCGMHSREARISRDRCDEAFFLVRQMALVASPAFLKDVQVSWGSIATVSQRLSCSLASEF